MEGDFRRGCLRPGEVRSQSGLLDPRFALECREREKRTVRSSPASVMMSITSNQPSMCRQSDWLTNRYPGKWRPSQVYSFEISRTSIALCQEVPTPSPSNSSLSDSSLFPAPRYPTEIRCRAFETGNSPQIPRITAESAHGTCESGNRTLITMALRLSSESRLDLAASRIARTAVPSGALVSNKVRFESESA